MSRSLQSYVAPILAAHPVWIPACCPVESDQKRPSRNGSRGWPSFSRGQVRSAFDVVGSASRRGRLNNFSGRLNVWRGRLSIDAVVSAFCAVGLASRRGRLSLSTRSAQRFSWSGQIRSWCGRLSFWSQSVQRSDAVSSAFRVVG